MSSRTSVEIWQGDALRCLELIPSASIDCVIADPPYGSTRNRWDVVIPLEPMWRELRRVCRGPVALTAIQPFSSLLVASNMSDFRHEWIWEKNKGSGHLNCAHAPLRHHESVLVFGPPSATYNPQKTSGHRPGNYARRTTFTSNYGAQHESAPYGGQTDRYPRSVQHFDVVNNDSPDRVHPTQKPLPLIEYLVATYSNPGDLVLDFAAGSGTTGLACQNLGRRAILIEIDGESCAVARARIGVRREASLQAASSRPEMEAPGQATNSDRGLDCGR
jgi:site-specific DNA-methyltransferase (adenine-specific)